MAVFPVPFPPRQTTFNTRNHKVHTYLEYQSVCPLIRIGTPPPSPTSVSPPGTKVGGGESLQPQKPTITEAYNHRSIQPQKHTTTETYNHRSIQPQKHTITEAYILQTPGSSVFNHRNPQSLNSAIIKPYKEKLREKQNKCLSIKEPKLCINVALDIYVCRHSRLTSHYLLAFVLE
jgi:hypothetical protein